MKPETIRAFIAVPLPADLKTELSRFQEQVKSTPALSAPAVQPEDECNVCKEVLNGHNSGSLKG